MESFKRRSGLPFTMQVRLVDGKNIWPTLDSFEVRSEFRTEQDTSSRLLSDLAPFMIPTYGVDDQANDIIITWSMKGDETRPFKTVSGFFDIILSDPGVVDDRGILILAGELEFEMTVTNTGVTP